MLSPAFGQTISVVDRSGKVVSTSKHLLHVFKDAKAAYRERKAEILAGRYGEEQRSQRPLHPYAYTVDDDRSSMHSRRSRSHRRPAADRRLSLGSEGSETGTIYPASRNRFEHDLGYTRPTLERSPTSPGLDRSVVSPRLERERSLRSPRSPSVSSSPPSPGVPRQGIARRHTSMNVHEELALRPRHARSYSVGAYDPDLAYGDFSPDLDVPQTGDEVELKGLVSKVKFLLVEAECLQYSVSTIISNLQKNPEAMAAVALTLAEISSLVAKMSPAILSSFRAGSPAVFALLASPQFMIAAGVGVGITIVAFGGYKIIKKIKAKNSEPKMDEMIELGSDVSRIESWRRGIAEAEASSIGTSVEGELITPKAAKLRAKMREEGVRESQREAEGIRSATGSRPSRNKTKSKSSRSSKTLEVGKDDKKHKEKKLSPLRLMFRSL